MTFAESLIEIGVMQEIFPLKRIAKLFSGY